MNVPWSRIELAYQPCLNNEQRTKAEPVIIPFSGLVRELFDSLPQLKNADEAWAWLATNLTYGYRRFRAPTGEIRIDHDYPYSDPVDIMLAVRIIAAADFDGAVGAFTHLLPFYGMKAADFPPYTPLYYLNLQLEAVLIGFLSIEVMLNKLDSYWYRQNGLDQPASGFKYSYSQQLDEKLIQLLITAIPPDLDNIDAPNPEFAKQTWFTSSGLNDKRWWTGGQLKSVLRYHFEQRDPQGKLARQLLRQIKQYLQTHNLISSGGRIGQAYENRTAVNIVLAVLEELEYIIFKRLSDGDRLSLVTGRVAKPKK